MYLKSMVLANPKSHLVFLCEVWCWSSSMHAYTQYTHTHTNARRTHTDYSPHNTHTHTHTHTHTCTLTVYSLQNTHSHTHTVYSPHNTHFHIHKHTHTPTHRAGSWARRPTVWALCWVDACSCRRWTSKDALWCEYVSIPYGWCVTTWLCVFLCVCVFVCEHCVWMHIAEWMLAAA